MQQSHSPWINLGETPGTMGPLVVPWASLRVHRCRDCGSRVTTVQLQESRLEKLIADHDSWRAEALRSRRALEASRAREARLMAALEASKGTIERALSDADPE